MELVEAALRSLDMRRLLILEAGEEAQVGQGGGCWHSRSLLLA